MIEFFKVRRRTARRLLGVAVIAGPLALAGHHPHAFGQLPHSTMAMAHPAVVQR